MEARRPLRRSRPAASRHGRLQLPKSDRVEQDLRPINIETSSGIISQCGDSNPHVSGADGQQLQCGAFDLKDETHKD